MSKSAGTYLRIRGEMEALEDYKHGQEVEVIVEVDKIEVSDMQDGTYVKTCKGKLLRIKE
jgi:hypothetical protein